MPYLTISLSLPVVTVLQATTYPCSTIPSTGSGTGDAWEALGLPAGKERQNMLWLPS